MRTAILALIAGLALAGCGPQPNGKAPAPPSGGSAVAPTAEEQPFADTAWRFARSDGAAVAPRIVLRAGGGIEGHSGAGEASWGVVAGALVFKNDAGEVITRFDRIARSADNRDVLMGTFAPDPSVTQVLTRDEGATLIDAARAGCAADAYAYSVAPETVVTYRLTADAPGALRAARVPSGAVMRLPVPEVVGIVSAGATRFDVNTYRIADDMTGFNICAE